MPETARTTFGRITQRRGVRQFVKFGIVGFSGFLVNLIVFTILQWQLHSPQQQQQWYYALFSAGFLAGAVSNYALNRMWTFRSTGNPAREGAQFLTVSVIALCVGLAVSFAAAPVLGRGHALWFVSTIAGIFINFFVNKYWTFRSVL